jgi:16S rRNA (cytidine1402-2'-O)-methyltransferase
VILYESPFRVKKTLDMIDGEDVWVVLARELTKIHEEFIRGPLPQVKEQLKDKEIKGECVLLLKRSIHD